MCSIRSKTRALAPLMLAALALLAGCGGGGDNTVTEEGTSLRGEESGGNPEAASDRAQAVMAERALSAAPFVQSAAAQPADPGTPSVAQATQDEPLYATPVRTLDEAMASGRIRKEAVDAARKDGSVAVIVRLKLPKRFRPEGGMNNVEMEQQRLDIRNTQAALLDKLAGHKFSAVRRMRTIAAMAMVADERTLEALVALGEVARVSVDRLDAPHLANSTRVVGSNNVRNALGSAGTGTAVAILDTGVDKSHPFLTGKVVSEACFSGPNLYASNLCPGGSSGTYVGSGVPCVTNLCEHGTHVAGIAAGRGGSGIAGFDGVAADASIIAIQMASLYSGRTCTDLGLPTPCPLFPLSNQIEALEHVLSLRNTFRIASVNMSLGAGSYTDQQKCDDDNPDLKDIIDNLRSAQIATVIAAGNGATVTLPGGATMFKPGVSAPACISSAVSVGATSNADAVLSLSQTAPFLDLLAPGNNINSSLAGGGFGLKTGTSMAAPHVTGSFAVLRALNPALGVPDMLKTLTATGLPVTDNRSGTPVSTPRLRVDSAVESQTGGPLRPTRLRVLNVTGSSIQVAWDDNSRGEMQFRIRAVPVISGPPVRVATAPQNASIGTAVDLAPDREYALTVLACDGSSAFAHCSTSNEVRQRTLNTLPSTPANLRASLVSSGGLTLTWDVASSNPISRFEFTGATSAQCPPLAVFNGATSGTFSRICSGLSAGTNYQLRVRSCNGTAPWHCSGWSNTVSVNTPTLGTLPAAPTDLRTCPTSGPVPVFCVGPVTLLWNDNSSNETRYEFESALATSANTGPPASWPASAWTRVSLAPNSSRYTPSSVTSGLIHYFRVRACDQSVCSAYSNIVSWTAP